MKPPVAVLIGNFDGVHRGHQELVARARALVETRARALVETRARALGETRARALEEAGGRVVAVTFDPHPAEALGRTPPPRLTTVARRTELLRDAGVDEVVVLPFTAALAAHTPEDFVVEALLPLAPTDVLVGGNFRFGHKRSGDRATLEALGARYGFSVGDGALLERGGEPVSSSRVRAAIAEGAVAEAAALLGRPHSLRGQVVGGDQKGRTIGFPTANLGGAVEQPPAHGVYITFVERLDGAGGILGRHPAVTNVGVRPTVTEVPELRVESHLLAGFDPFPEDLYGAEIRVLFIDRLRGEQRFASFDALRAQILADAAAATAAHRSGR